MDMDNNKDIIAFDEENINIKIKDNLDETTLNKIDKIKEIIEIDNKIFENLINARENYNNKKKLEKDEKNKLYEVYMAPIVNEQNRVINILLESKEVSKEDAKTLLEDWKDTILNHFKKMSETFTLKPTVDKISESMQKKIETALKAPAAANLGYKFSFWGGEQKSSKKNRYNLTNY
jgi:hypothetical protein